MSVSLQSVVVICLTVTCSVTSEGAKMDLSREVTLYTGQNLTLSCQPRDSPKHLVYWYKGARNQKGHENHISTGPSFTITKATVDNTTFYSCSAAEWGFWGIRHYILVNVIEPGKPSCANGWSLYGNSCFMHSARTVSESWCKAYDYCDKSFARLAKITSDSESLGFIKDLAKQVNASSVWIGSRSGVHFNCHNSQSGNRLCVKIYGKRSIQGKCAMTDKLPFICERVLPDAPKDVSIEHINCTTVRVGWGMAASGDTVIAYHVELSTSDGNVVTRISSSKERSLLLEHLHPKIEYRVRVQAESAAGNGSSSSYVTVNTKEDLPTMTSTKNEKVIAGHSITLKCGQSHQEITWYKDESAVPLARGQVYSIDNATTAHEGIYYCAVDNGPRRSMTEVLVIETPVISDVKGILLTQHDNGKDKRELLLLCNTANRHPPEYAWRKDGSPLVKGTATVNISLEKNTAAGEYECHVTNDAGSVSKSLVISLVGEPVELPVTKSSSASQIWIIAVLSILLAICFVGCVALSSIGKGLLIKISKPRKMTTQSVTSTEMVAIEDVDSPGPVSRTENVTRDNDEVFPYEVIQTWTGSNGPYRSLNRTENNNFHHQVDDPQVRRPDYTNISPSNRNDSAANCMYAPLRLSTVVAGSNTGRRPYVNVDTSEASSDM